MFYDPHQNLACTWIILCQDRTKNEKEYLLSSKLDENLNLGGDCNMFDLEK